MDTTKRILVVDDDGVLRETTEAILRSMGFQDVSVAKDGDDALERLIVDGNYDLVITDLNMPKMTGLQLTEKIRLHPDLKHTKVVMVSGELSAAEAYRNGVDDYLRKPISSEDLERSIEKLLP